MVAMNQAKKFIEQYKLTAEEIDSHTYLLAFDEISKEIVDFTDKTPIVNMGFLGGLNVIGEVVKKSKDQLTPSRKVNLIKKIKGNRTMILFLLGSQYEPLLDRIDTILKNHNL
jgi:hypothetical protein